MNQPATQTPAPEKYVPITADQLTPELIEEAVAQARRFDRNFANRDGSDAIPVPARMCRLLALTIINLHGRLHGKAEPASVAAPVEPQTAPAARKTDKADKKKAAPRSVSKKLQSGPPLTEEQRRAFDAVCGLLDAKQRVTSRAVARIGGWASHNTGARHIKNLIDLGYLKTVGKQKVITRTGLEP